MGELCSNSAKISLDRSASAFAAAQSFARMGKRGVCSLRMGAGSGMISGEKMNLPHVYIRFSGVAVKGFGKDDQEIPSAHAIAFSIHGKAGAALIKRNNFHFAVQVQFEMDFLVVKDLRPIVVLVEIIHKAFSLLKDIFRPVFSALWREL